MSRLPVILILIFIGQSAYCQFIPCKSYPMGGYRGNCELTYALSADRKYLYTSDRVTLKKWDIATSKVVEEIPGFLYSLEGATDDPRFLRIPLNQNSRTYAQEHLYDLQLRRVVPDPASALLQLLPAGAKKTFEKAQRETRFSVYFNTDSTFAGLVDGTGNIYQMEIRTGKMNFLFDGFAPQMLAKINTFFTSDDKNRLMLVNFVTGHKVQVKASFGAETAMATPDGKYIFMGGRDGFSFVDSNSGAEVFKHYDGNRIYFKSDQSEFYVLRVSWNDNLKYSVNNALRFSYPEFKELERIETRWGDYEKPEAIPFDPDKGLMYQLNGGLGLKTRDVKIPISTQYVPSADDLKAEVADRERNAKIGNDALEKLSTMKTPPIVHRIEPYVRPRITSYSDDGKVVIYSNYGDGGSVVIWSFPDGMPMAAYRDEISTARGVSAPAVLVSGAIKNATISPAGKVVALETSEDILFYTGDVQKSAFPKRLLLGLLDNAALLSDYTHKDVIMIDPSTGKTIGKVKTKDSREALGADPRINPGVFTFKEKERIGILDPAAPSEIRYTPIAQLPENDLARYELKGWTVADKVTGKIDQLPGIKPFTTVDHSKVQSNFLIAYYFNEGFYIYDLKQKKTINQKAIYPGWMNDYNVTFLPGINKLLVWTPAPVFTWPNATDQDPGASAFTIDVTTGVITPYLMSEPRSTYVAKENAQKAAAFRYASLPCEEKTKDFSAGDNIGSANHPRSIVLGYDCDVKAYVVARRSLLNPGSNSIVQVSRLFAVTEEELRSQGYIKVKKSHSVCPKCHGYPMEFSKQTTSGWSDWEQKSLNIYLYTRTWETKTEEIGTRCNVCKGEAWVNID